MYLCDFVTMDGQRHFVSANLCTGVVRMEVVTHEAYERFIRAVLAFDENAELPESSSAASEVSA